VLAATEILIATSGVENGEESEESEIKDQEEGKQDKKSRPGAQENQTRCSAKVGQKGEVSQGRPKEGRGL